MIRTSLLAIALALSSPAFAQDTPAGDTPSKEAKEAAKPNPDQVKATAEEAPMAALAIAVNARIAARCSTDPDYLDCAPRRNDCPNESGAARGRWRASSAQARPRRH